MQGLHVLSRYLYQQLMLVPQDKIGRYVNKSLEDPCIQ